MATIVEMARELRQLKDRKEEIGKEETEINKRVEELTKKLMPEAMDAEGISNINVEDVGRINLRAEVYTSIPAESRDAAYQWLRDTGRESLITETVNASTLKAAVKEWIKQSEQIPDCIKVTAVTVAVLTRG